LKTSLAHLPEHKQRELKGITETIVELVKPEMVILYGSYSRGNWVEDMYMEDGIFYTYTSDYDILVITKHHQDMPSGLAKQTRRRVKKSKYLETNIQMIFHDINFVNKELEEAHFFFVDIYKEGTMLYNAGNFELIKPPKELSPATRAYLAQQYFDVRYPEAIEFFDTVIDTVEKQRLKIAIFILHQAAERFYQTILLVFTHYKPRTHDLVILNKQSCAADARIKKVFPNKTEEEKHRFEVLVKAYIDSRYQPNYVVVPEELQWLISRVQMLKELTEVVCLEEIERFRNTRE
jgi:predicted nucleotidyltransferase/HEPN domain-containing protein